jgi:hypothetical protein
MAGQSMNSFSRHILRIQKQLECRNADSIHLAHNTVHRWALVNIALNLPAPKMRGIFSTSCPNTIFSRRVVTDNIRDLYLGGDLFESRLGHTLSSGLSRFYPFLQTNAGSFNIDHVTTAAFQTLPNSLLQQSSNHQYPQSEILDSVVT